jgi:hypothetical protein
LWTWVVHSEKKKDKWYLNNFVYTKEMMSPKLIKFNVKTIYNLKLGQFIFCSPNLRIQNTIMSHRQTNTVEHVSHNHHLWLRTQK